MKRSLIVRLLALGGLVLLAWPDGVRAGISDEFDPGRVEVINSKMQWDPSAPDFGWIFKSITPSSPTGKGSTADGHFPPDSRRIPGCEFTSTNDPACVKTWLVL